MNTSSEAIKLLNQALVDTNRAADMVDDLIAPHDFQDVASLMAKASAALLISSMRLLESNSQGAIEALETAEDLLDAFYDILDADTGEN